MGSPVRKCGPTGPIVDFNGASGARANPGFLLICGIRNITLAAPSRSRRVLLPWSIFRLRVLLRMNRRTKLHAHHAAALYALLCQANGVAHRSTPALPDGLLLDAPEQCRLDLHPGGEYAFGFTFLDESPATASRRLHRLFQGLRAVGKDAGPQHAAFGRNFKVGRIQDLVSGVDCDFDLGPTAISAEHLQGEIDRAKTFSEWTIQFTSPLRCSRPKGQRQGGHAFFDDRWFGTDSFLRRVRLRLERLGARESPTNGLMTPHPPARSSSPLPSATAPRLSRHNRLVWIDLTYGPAATRKALGGAMGTIELTDLTPEEIEDLVLGQYVGVGESTRFGFGRYRIAQLGPDPFPCRRAVSLLDLAFNARSLDEASHRYELDAGVVQPLAREAEAGTYTPSPPVKVTIRTGAKERELRIPVAADRALQRCVHELLAPALDLFFEESSLAFRAGLGRHRAARRVKQAWQDGYRWAAKADIHDFFNTVDHALLRSRLDAFLNDAPLVDLLMQWVETAAPHPDRGLPTGAVISPLLANLLLDQFDERVAQEGARLVRYADDFLILFRSSEEAQDLFDAARSTAEELRLTLNDSKSRLLDLSGPFHFLGFRFQHATQWEFRPNGEPMPLQDLGWHDTASREGMRSSRIVLPGELPAPLPGGDATLILGPGVQWLGESDGRLRYSVWAGGEPSRTVSLDRVEEILVIGRPTIARETLPLLRRHQTQLTLADTAGTAWGVFDADVVEPPADLVSLQAAATADPMVRLEISRPLIAAKLWNYAALAEAVPGRSPGDLAGQLRELSSRALQIGAIDQLLGIEGTAARLWYSSLGSRLPIEFPFERRVAPEAEDPVNALLNLGQVVLHRMAARLLRAAGLVTSLGLLHAPRSGHAALASDLQEPFRHLVDRVMLEAVRELNPSDFRRRPGGDFPLHIQPRALRRFLELLHWGLARDCIAEGEEEAAPYRLHLSRMVRRLKRVLLTPTAEWRVFRHRFPVSPGGSSP